MPSMNAAVSARLAEAGRLRSARRSPRASAIFSTRRERPVISSDGLVPEMLHHLVERGRDPQRVLPAKTGLPLYLRLLPSHYRADLCATVHRAEPNPDRPRRPRFIVHLR